MAKRWEPWQFLLACIGLVIVAAIGMWCLNRILDWRESAKNETLDFLDKWNSLSAAEKYRYEQRWK